VSLREAIVEHQASHDVVARLASLLDEALRESVLAAEVRALANAGSVSRLFHGLGQLLSQLTDFRWLALAPRDQRFGGALLIHAHPETAQVAVTEAQRALHVDADRPVPAITITADPSCARSAVGTGAAALVDPVGFGGNLLGWLGLATAARPSEQEIRIFRTVATELGGPMRMAILVNEARRLAAVDPLTGLLNRRAFCSAMERELARCERHRHPVSVLLLDVDRFKSINDNHGHGAGDAVLAAVGKILLAAARRSDLVARWGGEEFVVALPETNDFGGRIAAERLRACIEATRIALPDGGSDVSVTASIGVATLRAGESLDALVARADRAMYAAKVAGRNRVESLAA